MDRSLAWRLGLSAVIIPGLAALFTLDHYAGEPAPVLFTLTVLMAIRSAWELSHLGRFRDLRPRYPEAAAGAVLLLVAVWWPHLPGVDARWQIPELTMLTLALVLLGILASAAIRFRQPGKTLESLGATLLVLCYVGLLLAVTAQLRWVAGAQAGYLVLGSLVITAKFGDIGAYTAGRLFGRRKMAPSLSPGKTWAGFYGALGGAVLGALLWLTLATSRFEPEWPVPPAWAMIVYGLVIGLVGLFGDLCESLLKRDAGQKDASALLPGFGGLLDLLDSVLYAGPVALLLWRVLPLIPV